ncbi:hypothetical protein ABID21_001958 [Pseudorhizobium tarimense]|uniref:Uncharacterized protein n=1 Tax=Pseudorhizobium tarimense TaxID=1079109 RepID=A0ABV2H610_9HYPH|nr:hypothetical protein [Pseudorhizobium tarimense]MCJ8519049.1 hypothetical protein [Pseudorhizobium tarimense]
MDVDDSPEFVAEVIATGCDIRAGGADRDVVGDADLSEETYQEVEPELDPIWARYGEHDHLKHEIIEYLHSIGRSYPPPTIQQGSVGEIRAVCVIGWKSRGMPAEPGGLQNTASNTPTWVDECSNHNFI